MKFSKRKIFLTASAIFLVTAFAVFFAVQKNNFNIRKSLYALKTFPIHLTVDFGSAEKPVFDQELHVEADTSPKEAVSQVFPIMSGFACCSLKDLVAIDGVHIHPGQNQWWMCLVNGSQRVSARDYILKPGDHLEWKYVKTDQCVLNYQTDGK